MTSDESKDVYKVWEDGFKVRRMQKDDAKIVQKWFSAICATSCDLDVVLDDIYPRDVHGFYVGEYQGEVVASAIRIPVSEDVYYGSYYYVEEKFRSKGFGKRLRDEVAAPLLAGNVLAIDAHDELEAMNQKRGYTSDFKVVLYSGNITQDSLNSSDKSDCSIFDVDDIAFDKVFAYDNQCFIRPNSDYRRKTLQKWVNIPRGRTLVAMDDHGDVIGYGCRRPAFSEKNHLIGPLYADSYAIALGIFQSLCKDIVGQCVSINICEPNDAAISLVKCVGLRDELHMIRMYLNGSVDAINRRVFAITSIDVCGF